MSCALPAPLRLPFWGGERTILKRDAMLIRVKADSGLVGYAPGLAHERAAMNPQMTMMRKRVFRALHFSTMSAPGISSRK
jgi:hypothetical protein